MYIYGYFGMCEEDWDAQHWSFSESIVFCEVPVQPIRMCSVLTACQVHGGPASHMWHDVNFNRYDRYDLKFQILNTFNFGWPLQCPHEEQNQLNMDLRNA